MIRYFFMCVLILSVFQSFFAMEREQYNKKNFYLKMAAVCAVNVIGSGINIVVNQGLLVEPSSHAKPSSIPYACQTFCYPCKSEPQCCKEYCPPRVYEPTEFGMFSFFHLVGSSVGLIRSLQLAYKYHSDEQKVLPLSTVRGISNDDIL